MPPTAPPPTAAIDALFGEWDRPDSPGCALGIIRRGALIYARGYGAANLEYDLPLGPDAVFHVASVSKQFTAAAIVLLAQDGALGLDDDLRQHLPELPDLGRPISIRQALQHVGGLRDQWDLLQLAGWRAADLKTNADVLDLATRQRALNFAPGAEWLYSNTGYTLAALIVERVSGQTLRAFLHERLFAPLGMARTHFHDDHAEVVPGRAYAYVPRDGGGYRISIPDFDTVGATSLFTTVEDLARWIGHLEGQRQADTGLLATLRQPAVLNDGKATDYGLGLRVDRYRGTTLIEHSGADAGYRAHLLWLPDEGLAVAILCNLSTMNPAQLARRVADRCLGHAAAPPPAAGTPTPGELAALAGPYRHPATGFVQRVHVADDLLKLGHAPLTPLADGRFGVYGATVEFAARADGPRQLRFFPPDDKEPVLLGEAAPAAAPTPDDLAAYAGTYHSPEIDATYTLAVQDGALGLRHRKFANPRLHPTVADTFTNDYYQLAFTRDAAGRVTGFHLATGRVRALAFARI